MAAARCLCISAILVCIVSSVQAVIDGSRPHGHLIVPGIISFHFRQSFVLPLGMADPFEVQQEAIMMPSDEISIVDMIRLRSEMILRHMVLREAKLQFLKRLVFRQREVQRKLHELHEQLLSQRLQAMMDSLARNEKHKNTFATEVDRVSRKTTPQPSAPATTTTETAHQNQSTTVEPSTNGQMDGSTTASDKTVPKHATEAGEVEIEKESEEEDGAGGPESNSGDESTT